ncbi:hypothetical protein JXL21_11685 [Candidatus Bathyarchaeota archaeon]|nr:hypothetical protein [Candidatus Bathyarchaeota archaeon]
MGTYFKALSDEDEAVLLYSQVKIILGFICVVNSSEYLFKLFAGLGAGSGFYVADLLALLAVGCILIREGLRFTLSLIESRSL